LTTIILLTALASISVPFLTDKDGKTIRWYALGVGILEFIVMYYVFWAHYDTSSFGVLVGRKLSLASDPWAKLSSLDPWVICSPGDFGWAGDNAFNFCLLAGRS
jgi:hypothetical protein